MSFFSRLVLAVQYLFGRGALPTSAPALAERPAAPQLPPPAPVLTPEQRQGAALALLAMLQREGRLLDFLQEDLAQAADADVGAAARIVHEGCRKVLKQYLPVVAVVAQHEGDQVEVPQGYDASRFRLTGNVTGKGPWKGALKHHGWVASAVQLPAVPTTVDLKVLAPAEVELV